MFFVGPTGVGKTELAKSIAEFLFGDEEACIRLTSEALINLARFSRASVESSMLIPDLCFSEYMQKAHPIPHTCVMSIYSR